ncbi:MAG: aminotransferase class V-fold PLP-dependent enzyme [Eubacteriales bacterium]|nr:aminotransferase class V-fold PLP-dependent enzyme [Eubacteriales bacterium]
MKRIYLDNASTSFPKPEGVCEAVYDYMKYDACNIGRTSGGSVYAVEERIFDCRQRLCRLFGGSDPSHVIFTKNITESLNVILKGFLKPGDHVLVSAMEHNAVMRPLNELAAGSGSFGPVRSNGGDGTEGAGIGRAEGIRFDRIPCTAEGTLKIDEMEAMLTPRTRAVVMMHASNVCGTVMPYKAVGEFCRRHGLKFIADCAQTAGVLDINMEAMNIDALAFTGHKGLMGPQGIGGFILTREMAELTWPLITGGTGSASHTEVTPRFLPDRFEAGTFNIPGILGLLEALKFIEAVGTSEILRHELMLTGLFLDGVRGLAAAGKLKVAGIDRVAGIGEAGEVAGDAEGTGDAEDAGIDSAGPVPQRIGVVSIELPGRDAAEAADILDRDYGIVTRVGLHCAPNAHKTLGTFPQGTIRFSFGYFNTEEDVLATVRALWEMLK